MKLIDDAQTSILNVAGTLREIVNSGSAQYEGLFPLLVLCADELERVDHVLEHGPAGATAEQEAKRPSTVSSFEAERLELLAPYIDRAIYEAFEHLNEDRDRVRRARALLGTICNSEDVQLDGNQTRAALELAEEALLATQEHLRALQGMNRVEAFGQSVVEHVSSEKLANEPT